MIHQTTLPTEICLLVSVFPSSSEVGVKEESNTDNLLEENISWEMEKSAILCKQRWHNWPQSNKACEDAVLTITRDTFPSLHLHLPALKSTGSLRVRHDWAASLSLFPFMHWRRKWQPTPAFLPGESQGLGSLVGCHLWGCTESDTSEAT